MRIWSLDLSYLDRLRLTAVWREMLGARKALELQGGGYFSHPQLNRVKAHPQSLHVINHYLHAIWREADNRGYSYDQFKLSDIPPPVDRIPVTQGQVYYEAMHLLAKLKASDSLDEQPMLVADIINGLRVDPLFYIVPSMMIARWEVAYYRDKPKQEAFEMFKTVYHLEGRYYGNSS